MPADPLEAPISSDYRFFHLIRWESRMLGLYRRTPGWLLIAVPLLTAAVRMIWWAAAEREPLGYYVSNVHALAVVLLLVTPLHADVPDVGQATFGYMALRIAVYGVVACTKLFLPGIAAGTVANDRRNGRMEALQMTPVSVELLYLAKVFAAAYPFLLLEGALFVLFSGVAVADCVPAPEALRLALEGIGQIVMIACLSVSCSARFTTAGVARAVAYLIVWLLLPICWFGALQYLGCWPENHLIRGGWMPALLEDRMPHPFSAVVAWQATGTAAVCLLAFGLGVRKMSPYVAAV